MRLKAGALLAPNINFPDAQHKCYCYNNPPEECDEFFEPYSTLVNNPQYIAGQVPPCVLYQRTRLKTSPIFSIILPVNIQDKIIRENVQNILQFTQEAWEFIIVFDDSRDNSIKEVLAGLDAHGCIDPQNERIDYPYTNKSTDIKLASCNKELVRVLLINQQTAVFETTANNIGMRAAKGEFFVLLQDDHRPIALGWNTELAAPVRAFEDVVGVGARCAVDFFYIKRNESIGQDCELTPVEKPKCQFFIRDTVNRGPLLLHAEKVRILGYLDEQNLFLEGDDHDFFARAWFQHGWVAGWYPTSFEHLFAYGRSRKQHIEKSELEKAFMEARRQRGNGGGFLRQNVTAEQLASHNAVRIIPSPLCIN